MRSQVESMSRAEVDEVLAGIMAASVITIDTAELEEGMPFGLQVMHDDPDHYRNAETNPLVASNDPSPTWTGSKGPTKPRRWRYRPR